jgi:hypothetical protein
MSKARSLTLIRKEVLLQKPSASEVAGKSLELIRELFPSARRVAVLARARI